MSTNGKEKPAAIGLRPGLEDVMERQEKVLGELLSPLAPQRVLSWKAEVIRAGVGRISDGLRALLADPDLSPMLDVYLTGQHENPDIAETYRRLLHQSLSMEFASALEELSRISNEQIPGQGVSRGAFAPPQHTTTFR